MWKIFELFLLFLPQKVRVIPLGARVQANFPGGVRLGATNPTSFNLEFFVNDLGSPGASTFQTLGVMQVWGQYTLNYFHSDSILMTRALAKYF